MIYAGIDSGSRTVKAVLFDGDNVIGGDWAIQTIDQCKAAGDLLDGLLEKHSLTRTDIRKTVATGYARRMIDFAGRAVTEITCHARGVGHYFPQARSIIEIGGQDSKIIHLDNSGCVHDFAMNDRCAAGTGHFLEMVATKLEVPLHSLSELVSRSTNRINISSMCVVFAETEIVALLAEKVAPCDIASGVLRATASRVVSMSSADLAGPVVFTGGVAKIPAMHGIFGEQLGEDVLVPEAPQMTGAVGAAIIASEDDQ